MTQHPFTERGLGLAPFRICGEGDAGARRNHSFFCEYCGIILKNRHFIKSADGVVSVVGIDCLGKIDGELASSAKNFNRIQRSEQHAKDKQQNFELRFGKPFEQSQKEAQEQLQSFLEQWECLIDTHLSRALSADKGRFAYDMYQRLMDGHSLPKRLLPTVITIFTKHLSQGARKNSARFNEQEIVATELLKNINDIACHLEKAIDALDRMESIFAHYGVSDDILSFYDVWEKSSSQLKQFPLLQPST